MHVLLALIAVNLVAIAPAHGQPVRSTAIPATLNVESVRPQLQGQHPDCVRPAVTEGAIVAVDGFLSSRSSAESRCVSAGADPPSGHRNCLYFGTAGTVWAVWRARVV